MFQAGDFVVFIGDPKEKPYCVRHFDPLTQKVKIEDCLAGFSARLFKPAPVVELPPVEVTPLDFYPSDMDPAGFIIWKGTELCDICLENAVLHGMKSPDVVEVLPGENYDRESEGRRFRFAPRWRIGCAKHPPVTVCYNLDGSVSVNAPPGYGWSIVFRGLLVR